MRNICIVYPTQIIGGAELLFVRVLNFISQHYPEIRVSYINLADSIVNELLDQNVERIMVDKSIILPENSIIITHPNYYYRIPKIKTKNLFFLFWALHIDEFNLMKSVIKISQKDAVEKVRTMINNNALIVMDEATRIAASKFCSYDIDKKHIVPVVLEDYPCSSIKESLIDEECIHIAWIGRLSRDKIYALINLMNHLEKIKIIKKIKFHIIGEGNCKHLLREYRFETIYLGTISPKDLPSYLQTHIDIVFAMGTSMLEAEKCGIPAVYTFYSWEEYSRDCFVWAFKLKNYCLGYKWEDRLVSDEKLMSLEQILNDFLVNMPHCSKEAREHFESFLIHKHIDRFLACVDETSYSNEVLRKEKSKTKLERLKFKLIKKLRFYKLREDRI